MNYYDVIIRPLVTEKTNLQKELYNQVSFEVGRHANRIEIKRAVEKGFKAWWRRQVRPCQPSRQKTESTKKYQGNKRGAQHGTL